jgi:hypothetical protein
MQESGSDWFSTKENELIINQPAGFKPIDLKVVP